MGEMQSADYVAIVTAAAALLTVLSKMWIDRRTSALDASRSNAETLKLYEQIRRELVDEMRERLDAEQAARQALEKRIDLYVGYTRFLYDLFQTHAPRIKVPTIDEWAKTQSNNPGSGDGGNWQRWPGL